MKIEEYLIKQPMIQRYAHKYSAPLIRYFEQSIPDRYFNEWLSREDTTTEEIALYYLGVRNVTPGHFVAILAQLERQGLHDSEVVEGIMTPEYWEHWQCNQVLELMDARNNFIYHGRLAS